MGLSKHIAVLDLGTSGIRILVAKATEGRMPQIIAKRDCPCRGNEGGRLGDPEKVAEAVSGALEKIRQNTGLTVQSIYVSISADKLSFVKNEAETYFGEEKEITNKDVGMLLDSVTDVEIFDTEKLIGVAPIQYSTDREEQLEQPVGAVGRKLKVFANVILADRGYTDALRDCLSLAGVEIIGYVPMCLAMKWFIDNNFEEDSVLQIDVGATLTEYAVYYQGTPFSTGVLPVGGDFLGSDIAQVYGIPRIDADVLKEEYNAANVDAIGEDRSFALKNITSDGRESLKISDIVMVIEARINDTLEKVKSAVAEDQIDLGYVDAALITGDGFSKFRGIDANVRETLGIPLKDIDFGRAVGMKSAYTYACGMVLYVASQLPLGLHPSKVVREEISELANKKDSQGVFKKISDRFKKIFPGYRE